MTKATLVIALGVLVVAGGYALGAVLGLYGRHEGPGRVTETPRPAGTIAARTGAQRKAALARGVAAPKQVLFGDLHVHTTFSTDAFRGSLPMLQGEGAHPPADACDFARFCSALDFWSINDHAEGLTPQHWQETVDAIRQCNAVAGNPENPDTVAFLGWEWTQVGATREEHYGHKNVIFRDLGEDQVPRRPIAASGFVRQALGAVPLSLRMIPPLLDLPNRQRYFDLDRFIREIAATPECESDVPVQALPQNCLELAPTARDLFDKLTRWGFETIVIPHGMTWGLYTPSGWTWDEQLTSAQHDPEKQILIEVFSGHGNAEEHRDWRAVLVNEDGSVSCPAPIHGYLPSCWRAGEMIRERCEQVGLDEEECARRAADARQNYAEAGAAGWHTVPGVKIEDWLDSGQCRDCVLPAFNYRPGGAAQYAVALTNFDEREGPKRFRFGFMASSDNHTARPGTGYKELARGSMSDFRGPRDEAWRRRVSFDSGEPEPRSVPFDLASSELRPFQLVEFERQASFFLTGGLVAVHAESRRREAIWDALKRKEVYGTSGERILVWFDLMNPPGPAGQGSAPMGSEVEMSSAPRFRVRAVGAFKQEPGCPEYSMSALSPASLERLCRGECYNPSDERKLITRIEVIRIRPQARPGEAITPLIEDPWHVFQCRPDPIGCVASFIDPEFERAGRDTVYYVRAIQEEAPAVNAAALRCEYDETGECLSVDPCWGDYRIDPADDCLAPNEERAWSSPIYVDFAGPATAIQAKASVSSRAP